MPLLKLEKYYDLKNDSSRKDIYHKKLRILSNRTDSKIYFESDPKRKELRKKIIQEKLDQYRSIDKPTIHFVLGSIGSGKTSIKDKFFDSQSNFIYVNFDEIKKKLPEYNLLKEINPKKAAKFVQHESSTIAGKLLKKAIQKKCNIVFEKNVVKSKEGKFHLIEEITKAKKKGYRILIQVVFLDTFTEAWERVQIRAKDIKRYVPKSIVKDTFKTLFFNFNEILKSLSNKRFQVTFWYNGTGVKLPEPVCILLNGVRINGVKKDLLTVGSVEWQIFKGEDCCGIVNGQLNSSARKNLEKLDFFRKAEYIQKGKKR